jgi:hypothetical protein
MSNSFFALNLKATYGSWTLYRNGEYFARGFTDEKDAKAFAKEFCELNGYTFTWAK